MQRDRISSVLYRVCFVGSALLCVSGMLCRSLSGTAVPTVILDPGHGGPDRGVVGAGGMSEKEVTLDLARRVKGLIDQRLGYRTFLTREEDTEVSPDERAARANNQQGTLLVSIHLGGSFDPKIEGYGMYIAQASEGQGGAAAEALPLWNRQSLPFSGQSKRLAERLHRSFEKAFPRTGDLGIHPLALYLARAVRMPAVLIEPVVLSHPEGERFLGEEKNRQALAEAIFRGLMLYWQPDEDGGRDE